MVKKATLDDYRSTGQGSLYGERPDENPYGESIEALAEDSAYLSMSSTYPGVPDWVNNQDQSYGTDYLMRFVKADSDPDAAYELAGLHEFGGLPCGEDKISAAQWYQHAAAIGSVASAIYLFEFKKDPSFMESFLANSLTSLEGHLSHFEIERSFSDILALGKKLLEIEGEDSAAKYSFRGRVEYSFRAALNHRKARHVQQETLDQITKLQTSLYSAPENLPGLVVVKQEITDDADFKPGIYKNLQTRLALSAVNANLELIFEKLNQEFPWFNEANSLIFKQLQARLYSGTPAFKLRPMLLAGTPGVGKTSWAKRLAELCEVPFSTVMAAGSSDSMYLRGTPKGWSSARPSAVAKLIATERVANPLILVDEIDKTATDNRNGSILDVLLQLIEPATSKNYLDECLQVPCDFSWVSWIATCNTLGGLPKPLLDRFTVVLIEKPRPEHAQTIINGAIRAYAAELDIDCRMLPVLTGEDIEILTPLSPREINRVVRMMLENRLTETKRRALH